MRVPTIVSVDVVLSSETAFGTRANSFPFFIQLRVRWSRFIFQHIFNTSMDSVKCLLVVKLDEPRHQNGAHTGKSERVSIGGIHLEVHGKKSLHRCPLIYLAAASHHVAHAAATRARHSAARALRAQSLRPDMHDDGHNAEKHVERRPARLPWDLFYR